MSRTRTLTAAVGAMAAMVGMTIGGASVPAQASTRPADTPLAGSVAPFTSRTQATGNVASSQRLSIQLWLRPQVAAAQRFASAVSTPGNALFHHYVSPDGYAARFGATASEAGAVESWLRTEGFTSVHVNPQRSYVRATAATSKIDAAFHVQLKLYRASAAVNAGPYALRANGTSVFLPSSLASSVLGVTGLDNAAPIIPLDYQTSKTISGSAAGAARGVSAADLKAPCSKYYGQHEASGLPSQFGVTKFPTEVCGYSGGQLRAAYGATTQSTGTGQTIALVELGLTKDMFLTLKDYAAANGLPAPSAQRYTELSLGQGTACGDEFDVEEQLDVEASYDMAPGASQLVVGGDTCNDGDFGLQGLFNADLAVINGNGGRPLASAASNSWEGGDESQAPYLTNIEHAYLLQAATEGVGMYFSSGDGSGVETPSSDPYAVAVGGTTLGIGKTSNRLFETGWSTGISVLASGAWLFLGEQGAAGGGPSVLWKQPGYQKGVVPAALAKAPGNRGGPVRAVPDISADADPFTGLAVGLLTFHTKKHLPPTYSETDIGGTSLSSPTVAGMVIAAQQGQSGPFGFINPAIYKLAGTSAFFRTLPLTSHSPALYRGTSCDAATCGEQALTTFDDQSFSMFGYTGQVTLKGYDNMSGVGTPNGQDFITALRALEN
jgi:subtilase family serine protease